MQRPLVDRAGLQGIRGLPVRSFVFVACDGRQLTFTLIRHYRVCLSKLEVGERCNACLEPIARNWDSRGLLGGGCIARAAICELLLDLN
jgi:hypothetical protein